MTLIASLLPDIMIRELVGFLPPWWFLAKGVLLIAVVIYLLVGPRERSLAMYGVILTTVIVVQMITSRIDISAWWQSLFPSGSFSGQFGGAILLKFLGIIPVVGLLLLLYRSPSRVYLVKGDLSVKASRIGWLGIEEDKISWGKLSVISALLIAAGTFLLTLATVTGFSLSSTFSRLPSLLPLIVLFALVNSFSEGVVYRSAVLGPLMEVLPKDSIIIVAAAFFGFAHFYGAPGGIIGVMMSGVLGWYMCRSMYETRGIVSAWIIHFFQDIVIFSTIAVLGGF
ncbi:MAG: CPBP family intramembrane metalloprotease [Anaerolineae bacterium]|nr:CPBP family intramembrane metalloprotease [Anaerolineae bacterium]